MSDSLTFQFNTKTLMGQISGSIIDMPSIAATANRLRSDHPESEKAKHKKLTDFIELIEATRQYIERLQKDIEDLETRFRERDGDEWREKLALKILDPDEIPQQRDGESIEDYRKRLEPILINKMLNPDGSIKKQYLDDLELRDYAEWAQKKFHLNIARRYLIELENPITPPERIEEIYEDLKQNTDIETLVFAERGAAVESDAQEIVKNVVDESRDNKFAAHQSNYTIDDFGKPQV